MRADLGVPLVVMQALRDLDGGRMDVAMRAEIARRISVMMPELALAHVAADYRPVRSIAAIVDRGEPEAAGGVEEAMSPPTTHVPFDILSRVPVGAVPDKSVIINAMRWAADLSDKDVPRRPEILKQRLKDGTWSFTYTWRHEKLGAWRSAVDRLGERDMEDRIRFQMERMGYVAFVSVGQFGATPWGLGVKVRAK